MDKNLVVITGCDSGIGKALCGPMRARGYAVAASYLDKKDSSGGGGLYPFTMDLRREKDIEAFALGIMDLCSRGYRLSALVHNAGVALGGPVGDAPMDLFREVFEINYFGLVSLTKKLIPEIIRSRGTIAVIGSLAGKIAMPFLAPYASSKFALEGFCDSLRREMLPFGVHTVLVEPAAVATPIWNAALARDDSFVSPRYRVWIDTFREKFIRGGNEGLGTDRAAERIARIVTMKNPGPRYIIAKNSWLAKVETMIPDRVMDRLILAMLGMR